MREALRHESSIRTMTGVRVESVDLFFYRGGEADAVQAKCENKVHVDCNSSVRAFKPDIAEPTMTLTVNLIVRGDSRTYLAQILWRLNLYIS